MHLKREDVGFWLTNHVALSNFNESNYLKVLFTAQLFKQF